MHPDSPLGQGELLDSAGPEKGGQTWRKSLKTHTHTVTQRKEDKLQRQRKADTLQREAEKEKGGERQIKRTTHTHTVA
jgi:hypothetical protein